MSRKTGLSSVQTKLTSRLSNQFQKLKFARPYIIAPKTRTADLDLIILSVLSTFIKT